MSNPAFWGSPTRVICVGQSLIDQPIGNTFADRLRAALGGIPVIPTSLAGIAFLQWAAADWRHRIDVELGRSVRDVVHFLGGTTDYALGQSSIQCYGNQVTISTALKALRAAGAVKTIGSTTTPSTTITGPKETQRANGNGLVLADAADAFDDVADYAGLPHAADPTNPLYYSDGTHETGTLADEMVALVVPKILALAA